MRLAECASGTWLGSQHSLTPSFPSLHSKRQTLVLWPKLLRLNKSTAAAELAGPTSKQNSRKTSKEKRSYHSL